MEQHFLTYKESQISYLRFGTGPKLALCFHGYGENGISYSFFESYAGNEFTFIAIDLPFHGKTMWMSGLDLLPTDLESIINKILSENNFIYTDNNQSLTLIGYSLGGRIGLCLFQVIPQRVENILLLAPDGLKVNFWYWLSTQTWTGKKFFFFTMKYPRWFILFLKIFNALGFVNASIFKFVNYYIGDKEVRCLLYKRWTVLGKLKPDIKKIKSLIRKNKTKVTLVYGKHDRIIVPAGGDKFRKGIEDYATLAIINSGHQVLHEKHIGDLLPLLTGKKDNP